MRILYQVYWGAMEPLGRSLVLPPLARLARDGAQIDLVSFEKAVHLADPECRARMKERLTALGVRWLARQYHQRPAVPATAYDLAQGVLAGLGAAASGRPDVVVGRTYVGGIMGAVTAAILRAPFVFHNEGFWPDEQVEAGLWQRDSARYRLATSIARFLYRRADGVIALSHWARDQVLALRPGRDPSSVIVVPSCVDLEHFAAAADPRSDGKMRLLYTGSLGGRYRVEDMARFVLAARSESEQTKLTVLSHSDHGMIKARLRAGGLDDDSIRISYIDHGEMPREMRRHSAGLFFLAEGAGSRACSPTKIGEYWASGLPVVTTPGVGDVDEIVARDRVGVLVRDGSPAGMRAAAAELRDLLKDSHLAYRCRSAAVRHYSLDEAMENQLRLLNQVVRGSDAS